jgi:hypothetical protein
VDAESAVAEFDPAVGALPTGTVRGHPRREFESPPRQMSDRLVSLWSQQSRDESHRDEESILN